MKSITQVVENLIKPYIDGKDNNIYEVMGKNGAKNLFYFDIDKVKAANTAGVWNGLTYTINGVAFTINDDGTVTANGTASSSAYLYLSLRGTKMFALPVGKYIETGSPSVGCQIEMTYTDSNNARQTIGTETGEGQAFEVTAAMISSYFDIGFNLYVIKDETVSNVVFYPMIRLASDTDSTYQPYSKTNQQLTAENEALTKGLEDEAATRSVLGAKNILPFDLAYIKALNTNGTWAGNVYTYRDVDFTVNADGTVTANGTATGGNASIKLYNASANYEMLGKKVILNGCPSGGSATTYRIQAYRMGSADGSTGTYFDDGEGTIAFDALNNASGTVGSFAVAVYENATVTNLLFKPMVRLASDPDDTYEPYAKTNRELTAENQTLTNYANSQSNPNLFDNAWFTVNQRGFISGAVTNGTYILDRWLFRDNDSNITVSSGTNGLSIVGTPTNAGENLIFQAIEYDRIPNSVGKEITLSVMLADGTVYKSSHVLVSPTSSWQIQAAVDCGTFQVHLLTDGTTPSTFQVYLKSKDEAINATIRAIKLELGSVSTLANDTAPNYQQELAKCQRYFQKLDGGLDYVTLGMGGATSATSININVPLCVPMRANPSVNITADGIILIGNSQFLTDSTFTVSGDAYTPTSKRVAITAPNVAMTQNALYYVDLNKTSNKPVIELSADL